MIAKIKSYFNQVNNAVCFIKPGDYEKEHLIVDGEIHFIEHTIYIAPTSQCFHMATVNNFEKHLIEGFEISVGKRILFNPTTINMDHWFFGFGFNMVRQKEAPRLRIVGKKIDCKELILTTDVLIYPHLDLARTAMLYGFNKNAIDLQELEYYKIDGQNGIVLHQ